MSEEVLSGVRTYDDAGKVEIYLDFNNRHHAFRFTVGSKVGDIVIMLHNLAERLDRDPHLHEEEVP